MFSLIVLITIISIVSCKKETNSSLKPKNVHSINQNAKLLKAIVALGGMKFEVTYRDGCYSCTETYNWYGGVSSRTVSCSPGCNFCDIKGVIQLGMTINDGDGNPIGLNVPYSENQSHYYGMLAKTADESSLVFAIDSTKISNEIYAANFSMDSLYLDKGFVIDDEIFENINITRAQQIVPAGKYELLRFGNLIYWIVPLD